MPSPTLGPDDPLPRRPRRVLVTGASGSGKTTVAARIGAVLDIPHVEIDSLYHGPNWTPRESFVADVERFAATGCWVTEWQYGVVRGVLADRADLMVWLDLRRCTVMRQVVTRTLWRRIGRQELWNGNIEPLLRSIFTDREHIVRWAWHSIPRVEPRLMTLRARRPDLPVVRLGSRREVTRWATGPLRGSGAAGE
jgi:adenylate kinase family enzyme